jgi:hypothetical protein
MTTTGSGVPTDLAIRSIPLGVANLRLNIPSSTNQMGLTVVVRDSSTHQQIGRSTVLIANNGRIVERPLASQIQLNQLAYPTGVFSQLLDDEAQNRLHAYLEGTKRLKSLWEQSSSPSGDL